MHHIKDRADSWSNFVSHTNLSFGHWLLLGSHQDIQQITWKGTISSIKRPNWYENFSLTLIGVFNFLSSASLTIVINGLLTEDSLSPESKNEENVNCWWWIYLRQNWYKSRNHSTLHTASYDNLMPRAQFSFSFFLLWWILVDHPDLR